MAGENYSQRLERKFVDIVAMRMEEDNLKKGQFAMKVWPELSGNAAATKWAQIRSKTYHTGKPQSVTIADASRMALALGDDLGYLLSVAKRELDKEIRKGIR